MQRVATRATGATRRAVLGAAAGAAGMALAACAAAGGGGETGGAVRAPAQATAVTIWHSWDRVRQGPFEKVLADFQAKHPTIRPEQTVLTPGLEVLQKLQASAAGGAPPDLFNPYRSDLPLLSELGVPRALDDLAKRDKLDLGIYYKSEIESSRYKGRLGLLPCIPHNVEGLLFYNRALVKGAGLDFDRQAPATWTDLESASRQLTKQGPEGLTQVGLPLSVTYRALRAWLATDDAPLFSPDGKKSLLAERKTEEVAQWMVDFRKRVHGGREAQVAFTQRTGGGQGSPITTGAQAMALHNPGVWFNITSVLPDFDMGMFLIPVKQGAKLALPATFLSWGYGMAAQTRRPDHRLAAQQVHRRRQGHRRLVLPGAEPPLAGEALQRQPRVPQAPPQWDVVLRYMASAKADAVLPVDTAIVTALNEALAQVDQEKVPPAQGLRSAHEQVQRILDEHWAKAGK